MKFDKEKSCFVNDDGSKLKPTVSLVNKYRLPCGHIGFKSMPIHDVNTCKFVAVHARWRCYLSKELNKGL